MKTVSRAWERTVKGSFHPVYRATLCRDFQTGLSPQGDRLPVVDGVIHQDALASLFTSASLTVPGDLWPEDVVDVDSLAPYGTEVCMQSGVAYSDGLIELVSYGFLRIQDLRQGNESGSPIELTLEDRNASVSRARLLAPATFPGYYTNGQVVSELVLGALPEATIEWDDETVRDAPIRREITVQADRLGGVNSVMQANGQVARWDSRGVLRVSPAVSPFADPVATLTNGRGGVLVEASRELTAGQVVNAVVARGDGTAYGAGPYAVAIDNDPASPTRYSGRFGPAVKEISSSLITTNGQALVAAQAELARRQGLLHSLGLETMPRFELEPDDCVFVEGRKEAGRHFLQTLDIPFRADGTMSGTTRQASIGYGYPVVLG